MLNRAAATTSLHRPSRMTVRKQPIAAASAAAAQAANSGRAKAAKRVELIASPIVALAAVGLFFRAFWLLRGAKASRPTPSILGAAPKYSDKRQLIRAGPSAVHLPAGTKRQRHTRGFLHCRRIDDVQLRLRVLDILANANEVTIAFGRRWRTGNEHGLRQGAPGPGKNVDFFPVVTLNLPKQLPSVRPSCSPEIDARVAILHIDVLIGTRCVAFVNACEACRWRVE